MTHGINTGAPPADESATVFIAPEDVLARWDGRTATPNDLSRLPTRTHSMPSMSSSDAGRTSSCSTRCLRTRLAAKRWCGTS